MRRTGDHFPPIECMRISGGEMNKLAHFLFSLSLSFSSLLSHLFLDARKSESDSQGKHSSYRDWRGGGIHPHFFFLLSHFPFLTLADLSFACPHLQMEKPTQTKSSTSRKKIKTSNFTASTAHTAELSQLSISDHSKLSYVQRAKQSVPLAFALYMWNTLISWIWTFITSPASILIDPLSTTAALIIYPVVWIGLAIFTAIFWLAGISGGGKIIESISEKFANGYSMVNWVSLPSLSLSSLS